MNAVAPPRMDMAERDATYEPNGERRRVMVLGNCVAERLCRMLVEYPGFADAFTMLPTPMIHTVTDPARLQTLAEAAHTCDIVLTQPLFSFGPCNTEELRKTLRPGAQRLILFSSPDFEAYFPDVLRLEGKENLRFEPILDWDSAIIFSCFLAGVSIFEVEAIYRNHPLFHSEAVEKSITSALETYVRREQGLDLPTKAFVLRNYAGTRLFHSPKHPVDSFLLLMLRDMAAALGLDRNAPASAVDGFGFNSWPVITRHHGRFTFPEQDYFLLAGKRYGLEDVAMAYYNFYEFHPHVVEANKDKAIAV